MGISISKVLYDNEKEVTVSIVGIDGSGKTTILYKLLTGEIVKTIPTTGIYLILCIFIIYNIIFIFLHGHINLLLLFFIYVGLYYNYIYNY